MKLLYLWVQEYGIFRNRGFCFSAEYSFSFDPQKEVLSCRRNEECPFAIYNTGNVGLISYIVGDNGQGKTSLLKLLMEILPYEGSNRLRTPGYVLVLKDDNDAGLYAYTTLPGIRIQPQDGIQIRNCEGRAVRMMKLDDRDRYVCAEMQDTGLIFHSNVFDRDRYGTESFFRGVEDISFNGLLRLDFDDQTKPSDYDEKDQLKCYLMEDTLLQIRFVAAGSGEMYQGFIPFTLPASLNLIFREEDEMLDFVYAYDWKALSKAEMGKVYQYRSNLSYSELNGYSSSMLKEIVAHMCRDVIKRYDDLFQEQENRFYTLLHKGVLMSCIRMFFPVAEGKREFGQLIILISHLRQFMGIVHYDDSMTFVVKFIQNLRRGVANRFRQLMEELQRWEKEGKLQCITRQYDYFCIPPASNEELLVALCHFFAETSFGYDYLTFRWSGLSSGEYNLLSMYSRIYSLRDRLQKYNALIFLVDEADLSYHPKWQQGYVKYLVRFLNFLFPEHQIQIILATHSPIMLSDALRGNVVFLGRPQDEMLKNTFGANIYDLYREGMFLERGRLGIIGSYAAGKIEEVVQMLDQWEEEPDRIGDVFRSLEEMEKFIACIGDPAVKRILRGKWEKVDRMVRRGENTFMNEELAALAADLRKLPPEQLEQVLREIRRE